MDKLIAFMGAIGITSLFAWFKSRDNEPILSTSTSTKTYNNVGTYSSIFGDKSRDQIIADAKSELRQSKIAREGYRNCVYLDSLGKPTVGIGHLILPEDNLKIGDCISNERVDALYEKDQSIALNAAIRQADDLGRFTSEFIVALSHVNFQLGTGWTRTFSNTYNALKTGDYSTAINNLRNSRWNEQTPVRVADFIDAIYNAYA